MSMQSIDRAIDALVIREGRYVDHPADRGGPTCWGITELVARRHGYTGPMRELPKATARAIYWQDYVRGPGIDLLFTLSPRLAAEALDTGVNMGAPRGVMMLQRALNALNSGGRDWPDLAKVDGIWGGKSHAALAACARRRAAEEWEGVLLAAMNCQQGDRYLDIIDRNPSQEAFGWGWFRHRVLAPA
jgi:lysozyme family protein